MVHGCALRGISHEVRVSIAVRVWKRMTGIPSREHVRLGRNNGKRIHANNAGHYVGEDVVKDVLLQRPALPVFSSSRSR
jgi:hypothetical protein